MLATNLEDTNTLQIDSAALSDPGQKRDLNEDTVFHQTGQTDTGKIADLFLVCDGLGGHQAGEVASRMAVETITVDLAKLLSPSTPSAGPDSTQLSPHTVRQHIKAAIARANTQLVAYAHNHQQTAANLGTTVTLAVVYGNQVYIANVGDGRVYAWRNNKITQITQDHSLAATLAEMGQIDQEEIVDHPRSNVIIRALGSEETVKIDLFEWKPQAGDRLLLCSDGLWKAFSDKDELALRLRLPLSDADLCQQLVEEANRRDGSDNISVVIVSFRLAKHAVDYQE
jgi:protein phosphatase